MFSSKKTMLLILLLSAFTVTGCGTLAPWELISPGDLFDQVLFRGVAAETCTDVRAEGAIVGCLLEVELVNGSRKSVFCDRFQSDCWDAKPNFSEVIFDGQEEGGICFPRLLQIRTKGSR